MGQLETVLLEDDPKDLALVKKELEQRGIVVHPFQDGNEALRKLRTDPHIEVLITDIAIEYPEHVRSRPQGYTVANTMYAEYPDRYLGVVVLTGLDDERSFDANRLFTCAFEPFHKRKWLKLDPSDMRSWELTFDFLEELVRDTARQSWSHWEKLIKEVNPKSLWISGERPYLPTYIGLRRDKDWRTLESAIGKQALEIVAEYRKGNQRSLQGEFVTLSEKPTVSSFREHLIARRVLYAVKKLVPDNWEQWLQGFDRTDEERPEIDFWEEIESDKLRMTLNGINRLKAELVALTKQRSQSKDIVTGKRQRIFELLSNLVKEANAAAADESDLVQIGVAGMVRELESQLQYSDAAAVQANKSKTKPKLANRLQATLR